MVNSREYEKNQKNIVLILTPTSQNDIIILSNY